MILTLYCLAEPNRNVPRYVLDHYKCYPHIHAATKP